MWKELTQFVSMIITATCNWVLAYYTASLVYQRMISRDLRFVLDDVQAGAKDGSTFQCFSKGIGVDHGSGMSNSKHLSAHRRNACLSACM